MLALDGHSLVVVVTSAALARRTALKPVSGVDLNSRLGGQDLKQTAALRRVQLCGSLKLS